MNSGIINTFEEPLKDVYMRIVIVLVTFVLLLSSCEKSPKCWGKVEKNEGEIIADTTLCTNCTILTNENEGFVVNSQTDLWNIYYRNFGNQGTCEVRDFDFRNYSLLGMTTITSCKYKITREVTVDDAAEIYYYDIYIKECGSCDEKHYLPNWVMIPKLKLGYKVVFRSHVK
jgi:hypothetical protein